MCLRVSVRARTVFVQFLLRRSASDEEWNSCENEARETENRVKVQSQQWICSLKFAIARCCYCFLFRTRSSCAVISFVHFRFVAIRFASKSVACRLTTCSCYRETTQHFQIVSIFLDDFPSSNCFFMLVDSIENSVSCVLYNRRKIIYSRAQFCTQFVVIILACNRLAQLKRFYDQNFDEMKWNSSDDKRIAHR